MLRTASMMLAALAVACGQTPEDPFAPADPADHSVPVDEETAVDDAQGAGVELPAALDCGQRFSASLALRNAGTSTWRQADGYALGALDETDPFGAGAALELPAGVTVDPGEVWEFAYPMRAPDDDGTFDVAWRMVRNGSQWFGPVFRAPVVVACDPPAQDDDALAPEDDDTAGDDDDTAGDDDDIASDDDDIASDDDDTASDDEDVAGDDEEVPVADDAELLGPVAPFLVDCGDSAVASVILRNTGTALWTAAAGYELRLLPGYDASDAGLQDNEAHLGATAVGPGQEVTFAVPFTAPAEPRDHVLGWRMFHEPSGWFGGSGEIVLRVTCEAAPDDMVLVPAGPFEMGCWASPVELNCWADEEPRHTVTLSSYLIDRTEVTQEAYRECMDAGACSGPDGGFDPGAHPAYPVSDVTWQQAVTFCSWAGKRLPTEAEWEKAARGDADVRTFPWGDIYPDCTYVNYADCGYSKHDVGSHPAGASPYGAVDMSGNLWEYVSDWYSDETYGNGDNTNPQGPAGGTEHIFRGGAYKTGGTEMARLSIARRFIDTAGSHKDNRGFRCARSAD